jgi:hypothetical protein
MEFLQQLGSDARELLPRLLWSVAIVGVALASGLFEPTVDNAVAPAQPGTELTESN